MDTFRNYKGTASVTKEIGQGLTCSSLKLQPTRHGEKFGRWSKRECREINGPVYWVENERKMDVERKWRGQDGRMVS